MTLKTPRLGHGPIEMRRVESYEAIERIGDFWWKVDKERRRSIVIALPYGGSFCRVDWTIGYKNHCNAQWQWDGDKQKPTLTPSLHWVGAWHGYVRKGMLIEA